MGFSKAGLPDEFVFRVGKDSPKQVTLRTGLLRGDVIIMFTRVVYKGEGIRG
jgi:hypothetical protein